MESIGERIRQLRKSLDLNQTEFGRNIGLPQSVVTAWEREARIPNERQIILISSYYNISRDWLEKGDGEMFKEMTVDEELAFIFGKAMSEDADPRRKKLLKSIINIVNSIPDEALSMVGDYAKQISAALEDEAEK